MAGRMNRFNSKKFAAWKQRATGFAIVAVIALVLLAFLVSFLKILFFGLAAVGLGYAVWVVLQKNKKPGTVAAEPVFDVPATTVQSGPAKEADARARLADLKKQRNA